MTDTTHFPHMNPPILGGDGDLVFPWIRYWTPLNKPIQLGALAFWGGDSDGFLAAPPMI